MSKTREQRLQEIQSRDSEAMKNWIAQIDRVLDKDFARYEFVTIDVANMPALTFKALKKYYEELGYSMSFSSDQRDGDFITLK